MSQENQNRLEPLQIAYAIKEKIDELQGVIALLEDIAISKAQAISNYDRAIGLAMARLKNGGSLDIDGEIIRDPTATAMPYFAKSFCHKELFDKEMEECAYKIQLTKAECLRAQLNGYQSINKYFSEL